MKRMINIMLIIVLALTLTGCGNKIVKKSIEEAKAAIESKEYDKALVALEVALNEESDNSEALKLYSIIEDYIEAKDLLMKENNIDKVKKVLDGIDAEYVNYAIKEDIDSLKLQLEEKIKEYELVNSNLTNLLTLVDEKKYDEANALVEEINKGSLNKEQKDNVNELKTRIDSELAKIEADKKAAAEEEARLKEEARIAEEQIAEAEAKAEAEVRAKEGQNQQPSTREKAVELVRNYLIANGEYIPGIIQVDSETSTEYTIHCYDDMGDHIATSGWYYVNKSTGAVTSMF